MEKHPRPTAWIREKQLWSKRPKRASQDDVPSELEDLVSNYDDDGQFLGVADTRLLNQPVQLSPVAVIR